MMSVVEGAKVPAVPAAQPPRPRERGVLRRWAEATAFVALWMAIGWAARLDTNAYLLVGVPLTVAFQRWIRREPIRALWVREAPPFGRLWIVPALFLAVLPAAAMVAAINQHKWIIAGWMLAAVAGSAGAGYALTHLRRSTWRPFVLCQLTAGLMGTGALIAARAFSDVESPPDLRQGLHDFLLYFPIGFALEEVSFRGLLDSHLHRPGRRAGLASALFGSMLWGIWHLPTVPAASRTPETAVVLMVIHSMIGVPLAIYWRRSGNLVVPAFTHAMLDAVRNAFQLLE